MLEVCVMRALNGLQCRFVAEYVKDGNARQAALRAGYAESTATKQAYALVEDPRVQVLLGERAGFTPEVARLRMLGSEDCLLEVLTAMVCAEVTDVMGIDGRLLEVDAGDGVWHGVREVVVRELSDGSRESKVKMVDKVRAANSLMRLLDRLKAQGEAGAGHPDVHICYHYGEGGDVGAGQSAAGAGSDMKGDIVPIVSADVEAEMPIVSEDEVVGELSCVRGVESDMTGDAAAEAGSDIVPIVSAVVEAEMPIVSVDEVVERVVTCPYFSQVFCYDDALASNLLRCTRSTILTVSETRLECSRS
jgi:phage terminase small subunit